MNIARNSKISILARMCFIFATFSCTSCDISYTETKPKVSYLIDYSGSQTATEVAKKSFIETNEATLTLGYMPEARLWAKFRSPSTQETKSGLLLEFDHSSVDEFSLFEKIGTRYRYINTWGDKYKFSKRFLNYRNIVVPIEADTEFLISVNTKSSLKLPLSIWSKEHFFFHCLYEYSIFFSFYGILISFFLTNLIHGIRTKNRSYFLYCLFISSFALLHFSVDGLLYQFIIPNQPQLKKGLSLLFFLAFGTSYCFYIHSFLLRISKFKRQKAITNTITYISILSWILFSYLAIHEPYPKALKQGHINTIFSCFSYTSVAFYSWWKKKTPAIGYFLLALVAQSTGIVTYILKSKSVIPLIPFTAHSTKILFLLEFLFLSFAMSEFIRTIQNKAVRYDIVSVSFAKLMHECKKLFEAIYEATDNNDNKALKNIERKSHAVEYLMDELSSLSNEKNISSKIRFSYVTIGELIHSITKKTLSLNSQTNIQVNLDHNHMPRGNENLIESIFRNIIDNAIESTGGKTEITISSSEKEGRILFQIRNTNSHISDKINIYEPFITTKKSGSGLGLHICRSFLSLHGSNLNHVSSKRERWTEFYFDFEASNLPDELKFDANTSINAIFIDDSVEEVQKFVKYFRAKFNTEINIIGLVTDPDFAAEMTEKHLNSLDMIYIDRFLNGRDILKANLPKIFWDLGFKGKVCLFSSCPVEDYKSYGFTNAFDKSEIIK